MDLATILQIVLAILLLVSFVATYMASKTWHVAHVLLVLSIFIASSFYWYLAAITLKVHHSYRTEIVRLQDEIDLARKKVDALRNGATDDTVLAALEADGAPLGSSSIRSARTDIYKLSLDIGRVWTQCTATNVGREGTATVILESPRPHGIETGTVLYVFEEGDLSDGARYLGEFKVTAAHEEGVDLALLHRMSTRQMGQFTGSNSTWVLYEIMPIDRHDMFTGLDEQELSDLIPEESLSEYVKDGKPAEETDPVERIQGYKKDGTRATAEEAHKVIEKKYVRQLRDYEYLFYATNQMRLLLEVNIARIKTDTARLKVGLEKTEKNIDVRSQEKQNLGEDLAGFEKEVQILTNLKGALDRQYESLLSRVEKTLGETRGLAAKLAELQLKAAEEINHRTDHVSAAPTL